MLIYGVCGGCAGGGGGYTGTTCTCSPGSSEGRADARGAEGRVQSPTMRLYLSPLPACAAVSYQSETKGVIMLMPVTCIRCWREIDAHEGCERGGEDGRVPARQSYGVRAQR